MTREQIEHMVSRFLCWKLPATFSPDGGVKFDRHPNHEPIGTNIFTAVEAEAMVRHMLEGMPSLNAPINLCRHCGSPVHGEFIQSADGRMNHLSCYQQWVRKTLEAL